MTGRQFINECFTYNPESGLLLWNTRPLTHFKCGHGCKSFNAKLANHEAGSEQTHHVTGKTYRSVELKGVRYMTHQLISMIVNGYFVAQVDHINGDGTDNRLLNLRFVNKAVNARNQKQRCDNTTGVTGVSFNLNEKGHMKYRSRIYNNSNRREIKRFYSLFEAVCWRKSKEIEYGYHKNHGEVRPL